MERKGFTLIELLVVIVIIGILVAIALPNFIKIKDKAKEAEVKQNLHAIQLAVERYATDMDGNYPFFLFGGEALFNIGSVNYYTGHGGAEGRTGPFLWTENIHVPFDMFWGPWDTWDYSDTNWSSIIEGEVASAFGDTLSYEGYMPKYPTNPFQVNKKAITFGRPGLNISSSASSYGAWGCYGGEDGRKMWNLNMGWGECLQIVEFPDDLAPVDLDLPGNFSYHPRWGDGVSNFEHQACQMPWCNDDPWLPYNTYGGLLPDPLDEYVGGPTVTTDDQISSLDVLGYDLVAVGSPRTKGMDLDRSIAYSSYDHYFRTGYMTLGQEANPFVGPDAPEGDYDGTCDNYDERPLSDSIPDFYIIHLGSGMDKKVQNPTAAY
ncbi:type II secretion system protein [bacterium]|nr:type II secretion system protein [bacterium]